MKAIICVFFFVGFNFTLQAQKNDSTPLPLKINDLKKLGRDSLIKLAISKIDEPGFEVSAYDRIVVKATKKELIVDFLISVKIFDKKSCFYDAVHVALAGQGSGKSYHGFCDNAKFYELTPIKKKKMAFVFESINKSDEIGHVPNNKLSAGTTMEIEERLTFYHVETDSWSTHSVFDVDKITGKISNAHHKHYARGGDDKPEYEIIK